MNRYAPNSSVVDSSRLTTLWLATAISWSSRNAPFSGVRLHHLPYHVAREAVGLDKGLVEVEDHESEELSVI